jgi:hypothetical protein
MKAATGWISAPANRHTSAIRSSDKDAPFKPILLSTDAAASFSLGTSSSISLVNPVLNQYYKNMMSIESVISLLSPKVNAHFSHVPVKYSRQSAIAGSKPVNST